MSSGEDATLAFVLLTCSCPLFRVLSGRCTAASDKYSNDIACFTTALPASRLRSVDHWVASFGSDFRACMQVVLVSLAHVTDAST